jgi:hypothetical protein
LLRLWLHASGEMKRSLTMKKVLSHTLEPPGNANSRNAGHGTLNGVGITLITTISLILLLFGLEVHRYAEMRQSGSPTINNQPLPSSTLSTQTLRETVDAVVDVQLTRRAEEVATQVATWVTSPTLRSTTGALGLISTTPAPSNTQILETPTPNDQGTIEMLVATRFASYAQYSTANAIVNSLMTATADQLTMSSPPLATPNMNATVQAIVATRYTSLGEFATANAVINGIMTATAEQLTASAPTASAPDSDATINAIVATRIFSVEQYATANAIVNDLTTATAEQMTASAPSTATPDVSETLERLVATRFAAQEQSEEAEMIFRYLLTATVLAQTPDANID